jgi:hypothetical protein
LSATINCNETETLFRVEPLNCTCCHLAFFLWLCWTLVNLTSAGLSSYS